MTRIPPPNRYIGNRYMPVGPEVVGGEFASIERVGNRVVFNADQQGVRGIPAFFGRVQSIEPHSPNRWTYQIAEVLKLEEAYNLPSVRPNGRAGTAFNLKELTNGPTGVQGNGVNVDNLPDGFGLVPIPTGAVVLVYLWRLIGAGVSHEYWINEPNGVDGECP